MQVISIKLTNFKQYKDTEVNFSQGLTGFTGKNGSGKSTIFEAIAYALFGKADGLVGDIRNDKVAENAPVEVVLCFEEKGQDYKIIRRITGKNNSPSAELFRGEQLACSGVSAVNTQISLILKSDYKNFNLSFFARQKEVGQILTLGKTERSGHIRQMLGLSQLDRLEEGLKEKAKTLESELKGMKSGLMTDEQVENLNTDLKNLTQESAQITKNIKIAENEVTSAEAEKTRAISNFKAAQELQNKYYDLNKKIEVKQTEIANTEKSVKRLTAEIAELENKEAEFSSKLGLRDQYRKAEEELTSLRILRDRFNERERLEKNLNSYNESLDSLQRDLSQKSDELSALSGNNEKLKLKEAELKNLENSADENKTASAALELAMEPLKSAKSKDEKRLKKIQQLGHDADCPECERPLREHFEKLTGKYSESIAENEQKIQKLTEKLAEIQTRGNAINDQITVCRDDIRHLNELRSKAQSLDAVINTLARNKAEQESLIKATQTELETLGEISFDGAAFEETDQRVKQLKIANDALNKLEGEISYLPAKKSELPELSQKLNELNNNLAEHREHIREIGYDPLEFEKIQGARDLADNILQEKIEILGGLRSQRDVKDSEAAGVRTRIEDNDRNKKAVEETEYTKSLYERLKLTVSSFKNTVTSRELPEISRIATELFSKITSGRYEDLKISEDFELYVVRDSKEVLLSSLSGGEKDLAALCIRIALSKRISTLAGRNNMGFLALDEVFGSQDRERREELMLALNVISSEFRQIFVVSHNEDVQEAFPARLLISRKAGFSEAVMQRG